MFDKFGEFDSAEELNRAAAAQFKEGDEKAIYLLAEENGIDKEDADDYMDGLSEELVTPLMAAIGKLKMEKAEYKLGGILLDWTDDIVAMCMENPKMAIAVRRKGKGLDGYIALLAEEGYKNRTTVDRKIVDKAPTIKRIAGNHEFAIGIPDKKTRRILAEKYYMG